MVDVFFYDWFMVDGGGFFIMTGIRYDCCYLGKGTLPWATPCLGTSRFF